MIEVLAAATLVWLGVVIDVWHRRTRLVFVAGYEHRGCGERGRVVGCRWCVAEPKLPPTTYVQALGLWYAASAAACWLDEGFVEDHRRVQA